MNLQVNTQVKSISGKSYLQVRYLIILLSFLYAGIMMCGLVTAGTLQNDFFLTIPENAIIPIMSIDISSDGNNMAVATEREVWLFSLAELKIMNYLKFFGLTSGEVSYSPHNDLVAGSEVEGYVWIWSTKDGEAIKFMRGYSREGGGMEYIHSITFSNNGNYLVFGSAGSEVFLWDIHSWKQLEIFNHYGNAMKVRFSPDDRLLAVATGDVHAPDTSSANDGSMKGEIVLWDLKSKDNVASLKINTGGILASAVAFSPDGQFIAGGNTDGVIGIWNVNDGKLIARLKGHKKRIYNLSFSADGLLMASSSEDNSAIIWDMRRLKPLKTIRHDFRVFTAKFWRDNSVLITAHKKGIDLWRISDGKKLGSFVALKGRKYIIYTPEGFYETNEPDYQDYQGSLSQKTYHRREVVLRTIRGDN